MKWAIELGEHEIKYLRHKAIKGQASADFLVEIEDVTETTEEPPGVFQSKEP